MNDGRSIDEHLIAIFLSGIRKLDDGCWVCDRAFQMNHGYSEIKIGRGSKGVFRQTVHILSYQHFRGEIPEGMLVCHSCDVRSCCNPAHLFLGTYLDNQGDMANKDRVAFGERHYRAKLTEADVISIYRLGQAGLSHKAIADCFGVSASCIGKVLSGEDWQRLYKQHAA